MGSDMLKKPPQAPPLFTATPTAVTEDAERLIENSRKELDQIASAVQPEAATFANVLLPLAHVETALAFQRNLLDIYKAVATDERLRDASRKAHEKLDYFAIETAMRDDLHVLVEAVQKKNEDLDPESRHLLERVHQEYTRNGLQLPTGSKRDRFKDIKIRLVQLCAEFRKTLTEENSGIWFSPEALDGIPEDVLSGLEKGEGDNQGKLRLTFEDPDLFPAVRFAKSSDTRKRVLIGNENKCKQNVPLFKEVMLLRDEAARLLGYPNHAAFRLEAKMAKKPDVVNNFLNDLRTRLAPGGREEIEKLKQFKKTDVESRGEAFDDRYFLWDHTFYTRLMLEEQHSVDALKIAEYFPLHSTIARMLNIFQHLFGMVFEEVVGDKRDELAGSGNGRDLVWHDDVQVFCAWDDEDQGGGFLGYLYFDLFPREGKHGHASCFNLQPGYIQEDGTRWYPATVLVCNFTKPTATKPSLLKHDEVVTLFHELGHGIHDLVSKTIYARFHGTNTVIDFGEAPSQMLENWCWTPSQLQGLSRHYSSLSPEYLKTWQEQADGQAKPPPEQIPEEIIEAMIKARLVNATLFNLRQVQIGIFDMTVHQPESHEAMEQMDCSALWNRLRRDIVLTEGPEVWGDGYDWGHGEANFGHLMGDYDAGYYGYLSSQVYSTDMFYSVFKADPMNAAEGRRYRHSVLEKGGGQDEMKTLVDYLGREPRTEAFYKELGLA